MCVMHSSARMWHGAFLWRCNVQFFFHWIVVMWTYICCWRKPEPSLQLDLKSGTICWWTSDSRTCDTAVSDSRWSFFYLVSLTKVQCKSLFDRAFQMILFIHSLRVWPVAWMSLNFEWFLKLVCVTHYVTLNVILWAFYDLSRGKFTFFLISFVKRIQNDVRDDIMHDAKWS